MERSDEEKQELLTSLKKIEGQVRGIQRMIEEDRYCVDVLMQINAARAALQRVALTILKSHTRGCVAQAIRGDKGEDMVKELVMVLERFWK